jgi:stress response protein YsnF
MTSSFNEPTHHSLVSDQKQQMSEAIIYRLIESEVPLETSIALETSTPLESEATTTLVEQPVTVTPTLKPSTSSVHSIEPEPATTGSDHPVLESADNLPEQYLERGVQRTVPLLEERLVVRHQRRKIGEVIVRKEIETQIIEVPVRRERLIVEQIGSKPHQLAAIDLGQATLAEDKGFAGPQPAIKADFHSIQAASQFLMSLVDQPQADCQPVQIKITLSDPQLLQTYQRQLRNLD